ncbi:HNH endonuclease signature motif containing protein [Actinomycetospora sp. NBC_00405]|uniref:HNH endonuclease signature motif containing protein n=1 Tax=Actinomycetospora sp. NBC_00405 TaxID=2975952 RepID=UPI002E1C4DD8
MFEQVFASLPEGVATTPPGATLGALLEQVDPRAVSPHDTVTLALAWRRQLSHHEARYARAAREAALADPDLPGGRREGYGEFGADELRVALVESRTRVSKLLGQAQTAIEAIPELWAAWDAGLIDADRVRLCVTWTSSLSAEHAASVVRRVLPEAPALTLAGLIERLQQLATALDPLWAERLYENSRRQRRVRARRTESGTVNLSGLDLPLDAGALSTAHVEALALRAKALGHPGLIDTIRADIYLALLSPRPEGWADDALVAHVAANACPTDPRGRRAPVHVGGPPPAGEPADDRPEAEPRDAEPDDAEPDGTDDERETSSRPRGGGTRRSRIELRVGLLTLLGADEKPGFLPGYGVVHAPFARNFARQLCAAEWRVAVTDEEGRLIAALLTRRRPPGYATTPTDVPPIVPRPVVELHVRESELAALRLRDHPTWVAMLTDLQEQLRAWRPPEPRTPDDARRRVPPAALARWIQMRDRTCIFPPCRASALTADIDHTVAVVDDGPTAGANLDAACRHDHRVKHEAGWHLAQPEAGTFVWTSPTGHSYERAPRRVIPDVPDPAPGRYRSSTAPEGLASDEPIWTDDPYPDDARTGRAPPGSPPPRSPLPRTGRLPDEPPF